MALQRDKLAMISAGFSGTNHKIWSYIYTTDAIATIIAADYWDDVAAEEIVEEGDIFFIKGSDGNSLYQASVVTTSEITFAELSTDQWEVVSNALVPLTDTYGVTLPTGDFTATAGDFIATAGDFIATAGAITATAGDITATAGNITATAGDITATAGNVVATAGNLVATAGGVTLNGNTYYEDTVVVSSSELLALAASPKTLVAAPGAGKYLKFIGADLILDYNSAAYVEGTYNAAIRYTDGSGVIVSNEIETTGFLDQEADTMTSVVPVKDAIVALSGAVNKPLVLDNVGGGEWTTGDSPLNVVIRYEICDDTV